MLDHLLHNMQHLADGAMPLWSAVEFLMLHRSLLVLLPLLVAGQSGSQRTRGIVTLLLPRGRRLRGDAGESEESGGGDGRETVNHDLFLYFARRFPEWKSRNDAPLREPCDPASLLGSPIDIILPLSYLSIAPVRGFVYCPAVAFETPMNVAVRTKRAETPVRVSQVTSVRLVPWSVEVSMVAPLASALTTETTL
jgi:hypothetical protein